MYFSFKKLCKLPIKKKKNRVLSVILTWTSHSPFTGHSHDGQQLGQFYNNCFVDYVLPYNFHDPAKITENRKEDAKEAGSKDITLLNSTLDLKTIRHSHQTVYWSLSSQIQTIGLCLLVGSVQCKLYQQEVQGACYPPLACGSPQGQEWRTRLVPAQGYVKSRWAGDAYEWGQQERLHN